MFPLTNVGLHPGCLFFLKGGKEFYSYRENQENAYLVLVKPEDMPISVGEKTAQQGELYGSTKYYYETHINRFPFP